jgi:hypothetical protein
VHGAQWSLGGQVPRVAEPGRSITDAKTDPWGLPPSMVSTQCCQLALDRDPQRGADRMRSSSSSRARNRRGQPTSPAGTRCAVTPRLRDWVPRQLSRVSGCLTVRSRDHGESIEARHRPRAQLDADLLRYVYDRSSGDRGACVGNSLFPGRFAVCFGTRVRRRSAACPRFPGRVVVPMRVPDCWPQPLCSSFGLDGLGLGHGRRSAGSGRHQAGHARSRPHLTTRIGTSRRVGPARAKLTRSLAQDDDRSWSRAGPGEEVAISAPPAGLRRSALVSRSDSAMSAVLFINGDDARYSNLTTIAEMHSTASTGRCA